MKKKARSPRTFYILIIAVFKFYDFYDYCYF